MSLQRFAAGRQDANIVRSTLPLTNDQIARVAPSVFATAPHESRSDRYALVPTYEILQGLRGEGFQPFEARQSHTRVPGKAAFTRHLLRLRHASQVQSAVNETVPEIVLLNSHDGSSSYQLLAGFFRLVCSNGLIAGDITNDIRVTHSGDVQGRVIEGAYRVLDNLKQAGERIDIYKGIDLSVDEMYAFTSAASQLRWPDAATENGPKVRTTDLLQARRSEDVGTDLWSVFNIVQENIIKGGVRVHSASGRRGRGKPITSLNEDVKLNRALFTLADQLAKYKTGEANHLSDLIAHHHN